MPTDLGALRPALYGLDDYEVPRDYLYNFDALHHIAIANRSVLEI